MISLGIGDWGLGIGDWPNPQSPIPNTEKISLSYQELNPKFFSIFII